MTRRIGSFGWAALGLLGGAIAAMAFGVPAGELPIWMIFGVSFGMMFAALFGRSSRTSGDAGSTE